MFNNSFWISERIRLIIVLSIKINPMSLKRSLLFCALGAFVFALSSCKNENKPSAEEIVEAVVPDKISLFDGATFAGWKEYNSDTIGSKWTIQDSALVASIDGTIDNKGFGHSIITTEKYGNFELELDYKIAKGGNSGIIYHVVEDTAYSQDYETGPEFQVLDDEFSKSETLPFKMLGSLYAMFPPADTKKANPHTEWNRIKLIYNNGHVEHWLNGEKILEYTEGSEEYVKARAVSKWKDSAVWGSFKEGHIGLQDHGDAVWYKNITIKKL